MNEIRLTEEQARELIKSVWEYPVSKNLDGTKTHVDIWKEKGYIIQENTALEKAIDKIEKQLEIADSIKQAIKELLEVKE